MSAGAVSISNGIYTYDFTLNQNQDYDPDTNDTFDGSVAVGGVYAMIAGDANGNGVVDGTDLTTWRGQNGEEITYDLNGNLKNDMNLDGVINAVDRNRFQQKNASASSQGPGA